MSGYVIAPCKGCGVEIEDEPPITDDNWWCSSCWPREERRRLRADLSRERMAHLGSAFAFVGYYIISERRRNKQERSALDSFRKLMEETAANHELERAYAAMKKERDEARKRVESLEPEGNRLWNHVEEMKAALEELRPHKDHEDLCSANFDEGPCDCTFGTKHEIIDAAIDGRARP